jgi:hypothetical protein
MVVAGGDYQNGLQWVVHFFGTQIGTAKVFAKVLFSPSRHLLCLLTHLLRGTNLSSLLSQALSEEAKDKYDKDIFKVVDLVRFRFHPQCYASSQNSLRLFPLCGML